MEARNSQRGELKRARVAPNTAVAVPYRGVVLPTSVPTVFHSSRRVPPSSSSSTPLLAPSSSPAVVLPIAAPLVFPRAEEEDAASFGFGSVGSPSLYSMFGSLPPMEDISADMSVLDGFDWCEGDDSFGDLTLPPSAFVSVHTPPAMLSEHVHSEAVSGDSVEVIDLPDTRLHGFTFRACVCGCWERLSLHALPARTSPALSTLSPSSSSGGVITIMALPPQADVAHMCVELRCLPDLPAAWSLSVTPGGTPVLHTVTVSSLLEVGVNSLYLHVYSPLTAEV